MAMKVSLKAVYYTVAVLSFEDKKRCWWCITILYGLCVRVAFDKKESSILVQVTLCSRQLSSRQSASQPVPSLSTSQVCGSWHEQGRSVQRLFAHDHTSFLFGPNINSVKMWSPSCLSQSVF